MKRFLILNYLLVCFLNSNSQETNSWNTHSNYVESQSRPFLSQLDSTIYSESDLQIRLWYSNGWSRINRISLLLLVNRNNIWKGSYYTFSKRMRGEDTFKIEEKQMVGLNIDSIYTELVSHDLLTIKSDSIGFLLDREGNNRGSWTDSGPTVYLLEIITPAKKWALRYPCPQYFFTTYKLEALKKPLKIISSLMSLIGLSPC